LTMHLLPTLPDLLICLTDPAYFHASLIFQSKALAF
jgi:hypothetical protein